jgi:hypothetical protein
LFVSLSKNVGERKEKHCNNWHNNQSIMTVINARLIEDYRKIWRKIKIKQFQLEFSQKWKFQLSKILWWPPAACSLMENKVEGSNGGSVNWRGVEGWISREVSLPNSPQMSLA